MSGVQRSHEEAFDNYEPRFSNLGPFVVESTGNPYLGGHYKVWRIEDGKRTEMLFEGNACDLSGLIVEMESK